MHHRLSVLMLTLLALIATSASWGTADECQCTSPSADTPQHPNDTTHDVMSSLRVRRNEQPPEVATDEELLLAEYATQKNWNYVTIVTAGQCNLYYMWNTTVNLQQNKVILIKIV